MLSFVRTVRPQSLRTHASSTVLLDDATNSNPSVAKRTGEGVRGIAARFGVNPSTDAVLAIVAELGVDRPLG